MDADAIRTRESGLQTLLIAYISAGLFFLLLPGTFLGVWNLVSISEHHTVASLPQAWLQAHGHAQIFGWLGTFILGIGFYSLSKMASLAAPSLPNGWIAFGFWTSGVLLRWTACVTGWLWRAALPLSALLELIGFLIFFQTVSRHRPAPPRGLPSKRPPWMIAVLASTFGFFATLAANLSVAVYTSVRGSGPAIPMVLDQRLLALPLWAFLAPTVWAFNARWLPMFLGLRAPRSRFLFAAIACAWASAATMLAGWTALSVTLVLAAALGAAVALRVFEPAVQPAKLNGVHRSFPAFVRAAYFWLIAAVILSVAAAFADRAGGIWGASRHALTAGFLCTMVFAIGSKVLPAFAGGRILFSSALMFAALSLLTIGCTLRVSCEVLAYEGLAPWAWAVLPPSAIVEMAAVTLFAANLVLTFLRPPAHLISHKMMMMSSR